MIPLAIPCQKRGGDWVGGINTDSDPFFSNVISLLHFNGSGYSQVVVDEIFDLRNDIKKNNDKTDRFWVELPP